nr:alginate lyase family protein [Echinimonas agarilytica]
MVGAKSPLFQLSLPKTNHDKPLNDSPWLHQKALFWGDQTVDIESFPEWCFSYLTQRSVKHSDRHWTQLPDFDEELGDIKAVWELSRFDWLLVFIETAIAHQNIDLLYKANQWLSNWCQRNPVNQGPNWKCAQEASLRLLRVLMAARLLDQLTEPSDALVDFVEQHLQRIDATLFYAIAQDNNHATSEAVALYAGGSWLSRVKPKHRRARNWYRSGRQLMARAMKRLVDSDGCFSQYSVNYHRVMLDTMSLAKMWQHWLGLPELPNVVMKQAKRASTWLETLLIPETGDVPNLGANDGALFFAFSANHYRNFGSSVALANVLFGDERSIQTPKANVLLEIFEVEHQEARGTQIHDLRRNGLAVLCGGRWKALLRAPVYKFRTHHADGGHIDLWHGGRPVFLDSGTFSYLLPDHRMNQYSGVWGHNTVVFDERDQMLRVSRFLYAAQPKIRRFKQSHHHAELRYKDWLGAEHTRAVKLDEETFRIEDQVRGFKNQAELQFRLPEQDWLRQGNRVTLERVTLDFELPEEATLEIRDSEHSLFYGASSPALLIRITLLKAGQVVTRVSPL